MLSNSTEGYKFIKTKMQEWLRPFGFKSHGANTLYRVHGDTLQFLNFQKGIRHLSDQMTINVIVKGLFVPRCGFETLQPGGRIGLFLSQQKDKWWHCNNPETASSSLHDITEVLESSVIPFYERFGSSHTMSGLISDENFNFIWDNPHTFIDKGFFYLYLKKYEDAMTIFESNRPGSVPKFKTMKKLVSLKDFDAIDKILFDNIAFNRHKLQI